MGSYASVVEGRRERERRRKAKSKRERKKRKEREGRGTTTTVFILEKGFGLAFCHPLLTSVQPFSGKFSNVCHPLRPFLLHGQCLSDRSPRQSHGNRDGFTVAGNPCRIYRLHSSGYVFYLPFRISSALPLRQLQQGGALSRTTACTSSLSALLASCYEDIFFFLLFFFFFSGRIFKARWKTFSSRTLNFTNE